MGANALGNTVTTDTAGYYLFFTNFDVKDGDTNLKAYPPIRNSANLNLLWDCLKFNALDIITSNHSFIPPEYKILDSGDFSKAVPGINCLGYTLQAIWSRLRQHLLPKSDQYEHYIVRMAKWLSSTPARILGVLDKRGEIAVGKLADLVVWDPE
jgi:dihydroorotase-like cyclic amidohydrolase